MPLYDNQDQALDTIAKIQMQLETHLLSDNVSDFEIMYRTLKKRYCKDAQMMEFTDREILKTAHLPENIFRRMRKNNTGYYGPREDGCIRLALAMDIDNILDIDDLVMAGGYAAITEQRNASAKRYMLIVDLLIKTEDLSPEDKVKIFEQLA